MVTNILVTTCLNTLLLHTMKKTLFTHLLLGMTLLGSASAATTIFTTDYTAVGTFVQSDDFTSISTSALAYKLVNKPSGAEYVAGVVPGIASGTVGLASITKAGGYWAPAQNIEAANTPGYGAIWSYSDTSALSSYEMSTIDLSVYAFAGTGSSTSEGRGHSWTFALSVTAKGVAASTESSDWSIQTLTIPGGKYEDSLVSFDLGQFADVDFSQDFDLHIRAYTTTENAGKENGGGRPGINSISFGGTQSIPEPTTATLGLLGLAGLLLRRRRTV